MEVETPKMVWLIKIEQSEMNTFSSSVQPFSTEQVGLAHFKEYVRVERQSIEATPNERYRIIESEHCFEAWIVGASGITYRRISIEPSPVIGDN